MKKTAKQIREEAAKLLQQAEEQEKAEATRIGFEVLKLYRANALNLDQIVAIIKKTTGE